MVNGVSIISIINNNLKVFRDVILSNYLLNRDYLMFTAVDKQHQREREGRMEASFKPLSEIHYISINSLANWHLI